MKNVFRLFGRFTMVMMIIGMVTLTSCEKEDVFDGKKPTDQVLGGGDEIGNPEDFYPYTDKVISEIEIESVGEEHADINVYVINNNKDTVNRRRLVFKGKKTMVDTIMVGGLIIFELNNKDPEKMKRVSLKHNVIFFKNNEVTKSKERLSTLNRYFTKVDIKFDSIEELYNEI